MTDTTERLFAPPVQIVPTADGAIIRRGSIRLHVKGEHAGSILLEIVESASRPNGTTAAEICAAYEASIRGAISDLINALLSNRLLASLAQNGESFLTRGATEGREDVFYWSFGTDRAEIARSLSTPRIAVIGVNAISEALSQGLRQSGLGNVTVVDHPLLRSIKYSRHDGTLDGTAWSQAAPVDYHAWSSTSELPDCLVVTTDFGGLSLMREWNRFCVDERIAFYPVVLQDMTGFVGPLVIPEKTSCFECFWVRQNSKLGGEAAHRETEDVAFQGQIVDGLHPSIAAALGHIAAFELQRFYAGCPPGSRMNTVIEIDVIGSTMTPRKVLRVPRCTVCGTSRKYTRIAIERVEDRTVDAQG